MGEHCHSAQCRTCFRCEKPLWWQAFDQTMNKLFCLKQTEAFFVNCRKWQHPSMNQQEVLKPVFALNHIAMMTWWQITDYDWSPLTAGLRSWFWSKWSECLAVSKISVHRVSSSCCCCFWCNFTLHSSREATVTVWVFQRSRSDPGGCKQEVMFTTPETADVWKTDQLCYCLRHLIYKHKFLIKFFSFLIRCILFYISLIWFT